MEDIIRKAKVLIEALPYIQSFRDKYVVVKLGGSMMADRERVAAILMDVVFMEQVGMRLVVVLGGGPLISAEMKKRGKEPVFVDGRRTTDEETLAIADDVIGGQLLPWAAGRIEEFGGKAEVLGHKLRNAVWAERSAESGALGLVGEPVRVDTDVIVDACSNYSIAVMGPICPDEDGGLLNVNADHIASAAAKALGAEKIVFLSNVEGVLKDAADAGSLISTLKRNEVDFLIEDGTISAGMKPKVNSCMDAMDGGVKKAHIVDGRTPHSLLLEIFTDKGVGTQIING